MDPDRFDRLAMTVGQRTTRRTALQLLSAALATALGVRGQGEARADHFDCRHVGERCRKGRQCCSSKCQRPPGGGRRVCTKTTSPDPDCAGGDACCPNGVCTDCSRRGDPSGSCFCGTTAEGGGICWAQIADECGAGCTTSDDCGPDAVCVAAPCCPSTTTGKVCTQFVQRCKIRT